MTPIELIESLEKSKAIVTANVPKADIYLGLAEECNELSKACLKLKRAVEQANPTPVSVGEAKAQVIEELTDVWLYVYMLGIFPDDEIATDKAIRWSTRVAEHPRMNG